ncbi:MAG: hypothetical protein LC745_07710, partial [Planctomycetia bacterium]|nr:hypothetical protein [Planctomycetia bacterium]
LEDQAATEHTPKAWSAAFRQWQSIALRLGRARTRPAEYYEAWYHAAYALSKENKAKEARQTLAGVMRLSPTLGGPEMKRKYQALLEQIK